MRHALVTGGSGAVGQAAVRALRQQGHPVTFTFWRSDAKAMALAQETGAWPVRVDLRRADGAACALDQAQALAALPSILVHAAGVSPQPSDLASLDEDAWQTTLQINCISAVQLVQALARQRAALALDPDDPAHRLAHEHAGVDVVLVGALERAQSLPLPVGFAMSQGALNASCMALAHELGPAGWRLNVLACGLLQTGLSAQLDPKLREAFTRHSAMQRPGQPDEIARAIVWLATQNTYMSGEVIAINGGL